MVLTLINHPHIGSPLLISDVAIASVVPGARCSTKWHLCAKVLFLFDPLSKKSVEF